MMCATLIWFLGFGLWSLLLGTFYASNTVWLVSYSLLFAGGFFFLGGAGWLLVSFLGLIFAGSAPFLFSKQLRRQFISPHILKLFGSLAPKLSQTESEALNAGTVSFEGELFKGKIDYEKLYELPPTSLREDEQAFLDGPVEELCKMANDYDIEKRQDLPKEVWDFLKKEGFLGLIVPKKYGGREFSAWGHAAVVHKAGSKSIPLLISIAVPNSLGPAELLMRYGTEAQKDHYLPRLANGTEIPCFALTGPYAGSDAASMRDFGVVCEQEWDGKKTLGIRLNFDKRYITLAPIATLIGLAFKLKDPDHLLSDKEDLGITCALVPSNLKGITIGRRHNPLNVAFLNGPLQGKDVFIPLDLIIGGKDRVGQGWRMLMECLSAGRAITLPSGASAGTAGTTLLTSAYARIRHQFGLPLGRFEGVARAISKSALLAYINQSCYRFTLAAVDDGHEPPVASAIVKYHTTENCREAVNHAMDVHGGKAICLGERNYLATLYNAIPVNITVEGANILTRNVIIFGQGAMRCHPFILKEIQAATDNNLKDFDAAFFGHIKGAICNTLRSFTLASWHRIKSPFAVRTIGYYEEQLDRYAASFVTATELSMASMGATLKRKEQISARLGDLLSFLYLGVSVLKRHQEDGQPVEDRPLLRLSMDHILAELEKTLYELSANLPSKIAGALVKLVTLPLGRKEKGPTDEDMLKVTDILMHDSDLRKRLAEGLYITDDGENPFALLEKTFHLALKAEPLEKLVRKAEKEGKISGLSEQSLVEDAHAKKLINDTDKETLTKLAALRKEVIAVDDFDPKEVML